MEYNDADTVANAGQRRAYNTICRVEHGLRGSGRGFALVRRRSHGGSVAVTRIVSLVRIRMLPEHVLDAKPARPTCRDSAASSGRNDTPARTG